MPSKAQECWEEAYLAQAPAICKEYSTCMYNLITNYCESILNY